MYTKQDFIDIYENNITREGSKQLLEYLTSPASDFFTAPASGGFHGSYTGGLLDHSINVYNCLKDYLARDRVRDVYRITPSEESIAITALLHDICKIGCYKTEYRNAKDESGQWQKVPFFKFSDPLPYGHGEKSVYMITGFMKLTRDEAFAIRYHMGFSGVEDKRSIGDAFEQFPLAFALSTADMEATYYIEGKD